MKGFLFLAAVAGAGVLLSLEAMSQQPRPQPPELGQVLPPFVRGKIKFNLEQQGKIRALES